MTGKRIAINSRVVFALIALFICLGSQLLINISAYAQTKKVPTPGSRALGQQDPDGTAQQTQPTAQYIYNSDGQMQQVPPSTETNQQTINRRVNRILNGEREMQVFQGAPLAIQAAEQGQADVIRRAANNVLNASLGSVNETYKGLHQWFKDDLVGNLFSNIGQLIGKWLSELINGWISDAVQFLARFLRVFVLNPNIATNGLNGGPDDGISKWVRQGADIMYGIAVDLLLLLFILCIWKFWADAAWRGAGNLMAPVGRLIFTAGLLIAWPTLYAFEIQITNEMIKEIYFNSSEQVYMLEYALASAVKGGVIAAGAGALTVFAPILAQAALPGVGGLVGGFFYFASLIIFTILGGILIAELVYILVLKAIQTALLTAQYMFAPIFLVFFAIPTTENVATGFIRAFVETSLWTFVWVGLLKIMVIILFSDYNPWGKILISVGVLQLMIQVPSFLARAQISPMSDFISAGLITGTAFKMLGGIGGAVTALRDKGMNWYTNDRFSDTGLSLATNTELNGLPVQNTNPAQLRAINSASEAERNKLQTQNPALTPPLRTPATPGTPGTPPVGSPPVTPPAGTGGTPPTPPLTTPGGATAAQQQANAAAQQQANASTAPPVGQNPVTPQMPGPPITPGTGAATAAGAAAAIGAGLAGAQTGGGMMRVTTPNGMKYELPISDIDGWDRTGLGNVPLRQLLGAIMSCEKGVRMSNQGTSITGSIHGVEQVNLRKGLSDSEKTHALYAAAYANEVSSDSKAQDAARQAAIYAGANQPQGIFETMVANTLGNNGGSWNKTALSKQRFQQAMFQQAALGAQAYVANNPNDPNHNAYTNYLRDKYGDWNSSRDAMAEHIVTMPESSESAWNQNRKAGFEACVRAGMPISTETIGALQNFAIQQLHPSRQKQAAIATLALVAPGIRAQYPVDASAPDAQRADQQTVQNLALAEAARNLPAADVNTAYAMYQVSGQTDITPQNVAAIQAMGGDAGIAYPSLARVAPHVARRMGHLSQNADPGAIQTMTNLEQEIVPGPGQTQSETYRQVLTTAAGVLRAGELNGIEMKTVLNPEVGPEMLKFLSPDLHNIQSPAAQQRLRAISTNMKIAGTANDEPTFSAVLDMMHTGGTRYDTEHVIQARARHVENNGNRLANMAQIVEFDLAQQTAGQTTLPLSDMQAAVAPFINGQTNDYRQSPAIAKIVVHNRTAGNNQIHLNKQNINLVVETMQDNGGDLNGEHFTVLARVQEATRSRDAGTTAGIVEVATKYYMESTIAGIQDPNARQTAQDVLASGNIGSMFDNMASNWGNGSTGSSVANSIGNTIINVQRKGGFSNYQLQDPQIVNIIMEEESNGATSQRMQAINVVTHMMGVDHGRDDNAQGYNYVSATTEVLNNSKPGSMRNLNQDSIMASNALYNAREDYISNHSGDQTKMDDISKYFRFNEFAVRMTMNDAAWQGNHNVCSGDTLIEEIINANKNRNNNNP